MLYALHALVLYIHLLTELNSGIKMYFIYPWNYLSDISLSPSVV